MLMHLLQPMHKLLLQKKQMHNAPVTTDAEVITAEEADAMSVKLPNGNEYVIDSKGNITNKKSGKAIKRTSVTGKSVLKASEEVKAKKPATTQENY